MNTDTTTREEHLEWCKKRALQYCDDGDVHGAYSSMASDLSKHPETKDHGATETCFLMLLSGHLSHPQKMREFILGFR